MQYVPFILKINLQTPVLLTKGYLTLDAMLAVALETVAGTVVKQDDIPLATEGGIKKCSAAFFAQPSAFTTHDFYYRIRPGEMIDIPDLVNPKRGGSYTLNQDSETFKAAWTSYFKATTDFVCWFGVGDPDAVVDLISVLPGVGAKASLGFGQFNLDTLRIEMGVADCSFSLYGKPSRPVPIDLWQGGSCNSGLASVRHPYWQSQRVMCALPSSQFMPRNMLNASSIRP